MLIVDKGWKLVMCFILNYFVEQFKSMNYSKANTKLFLIIETNDPNHSVNLFKCANFQDF